MFSGFAPGQFALRCGTVFCRRAQLGHVSDSPGARVRPVPLSEDEQRILHEIEQRFYANDPERAKRISSSTLPRYLARNCRWAALGFVVGLVVLLASFATSWLVGVFGFVVMLVSAIALTQNLRKMGRHGWQQLTETVKARNANDTWSDARERLRKRFGGDA